MVFIQAATRATSGASFLDTHAPGWAARANPQTLDMECEDTCILAQLFGVYAQGAFELKLTPEHQYVLGFFTPKSTAFSQELQYAFLTKAWIEQITARRQVEEAPEPKRAVA